jgi:tape measure domain-containing protein
MPDFAVRTAFTAVDKVSPAFNRMGNAADSFTKRTSGLFAGLAGQLGLFGGFALAAMGMKKVVSEAANFENSVANFTTLLGGSQSEAEKLVNTLQVLGAETPFQFSDLSDATQRLIGFGVATKDTVAPTLRMLGDLAQGNAEKLQGISLVYGQIMAGGKMMGQDFNQLINQGVPIAQGLAKVWGVDVNEAIKRVKQNGPVAAKDVQAAMIQMTSAGGMFYQGMMRSSKTLTGLWSTFMDSISMTASVIGQELLPYIKEVVVWATDGMTAIMNFTKENKQVIGFLIKSIPWVVGALVAWKVATYAVAAAQLFMAAGPIGLIILGITALITAGYFLIKNWGKVKEFFAGLWTGIVDGFNSAIEWIVAKFTAVVGWVSRKWQSVKSFFGFANDAGNKADNARGMNAPNRAATELQAGNTNVNIYSNGTEAKAEVTPRRGATVNMKRLGYQQ